MSAKSEKIWKKAAQTIVKAGYVPFPINDTLIEMLKILITEEQAIFIHQVFKKSSLRMDQIKERTELDDASIMKLLNDLMDGGVVVSSFSRTTGVDIYRLMGPFPGIFEYTFMRGESTEKEKKLVLLFEKMFNDMVEVVQKNYDVVAKMTKDSPPITRIVPVEGLVEVGHEEVIPREELSKILDEYDIFAKTHCYCRHEKDLLNDPCKVTKEKYNCLLLDKSAKYCIDHNFGEAITKEEAKRILIEAEDIGLVHKIFHVHLDTSRNIEGICSCCKCCCGIFQSYYRGMGPFHSLTSYLAKVNEEDCIGCGTCVEKCPMETIELVDATAVITEEKCIGCGVCAHHCPEDAIKLERTGSREVFLPPKKISQSQGS
ncbi:MAG: 4Fe-4S binding protein [Promethearchaeota archaeon]